MPNAVFHLTRVKPWSHGSKSIEKATQPSLTSKCLLFWLSELCTSIVPIITAIIHACDLLWQWAEKHHLISSLATVTRMYRNSVYLTGWLLFWRKTDSRKICLNIIFDILKKSTHVKTPELLLWLWSLAQHFQLIMTFVECSYWLLE